jgi:hypothetical protein
MKSKTISAANLQDGDRFFVPNHEGGFCGLPISLTISVPGMITATTPNGGRRILAPWEQVTIAD